VLYHLWIETGSINLSPIEIMTAYIEIKLFATLSEFQPDSSDRYQILEGWTVGDLLAQLKVPEEKAKLIFINGVKSGVSSSLEPDDRVGIFPPVGGG